MKKVKLDISQGDLSTLMAFIEWSLENADLLGYTAARYDKMILASLGELLEKLNSAYSPFKKQYKLQINTSQAMAFLMHCLRDTTHLPSAGLNTLRHVLGLIDLQTKN